MKAIVLSGTCMLLAALGAAAAGAAEADSPVDRGAASFRVYCAGCHGSGGRGDGVAARDLEPPPPDLTRLADRNDGEFPAERTRRVIDGRDEIPAHGPRSMPVWGLTFRDPGRDDDQRTEIAQRILELTLFLESIQVSESEGSDS